MKILMVCLGNICRSPLAEGILRQKIEEKGLAWEVDSAGTNGLHVGEAPHHLSQKVARINGIDISDQRSRRFEAADFDRFDLIFAMAGDVMEHMKRIARNRFDARKADLLLNVLTPESGQDVPDPWYGGEPGYHEVYEMISRACDAIVERAANR